MSSNTWGDNVFSGFTAKPEKDTPLERIEDFMKERQFNGELCTYCTPNTSSCDPKRLQFSDIRAIIEENRRLRGMLSDYAETIGNFSGSKK